MNSAAKTIALNDKFAPSRGGDAGVRTGPSRFTLKVRKCFVLVGGLHYCQLPKLGVGDVIDLSRFSNQGLVFELLITFPIHLQIVPRWTQRAMTQRSVTSFRTHA